MKIKMIIAMMVLSLGTLAQPLPKEKMTSGRFFTIVLNLNEDINHKWTKREVFEIVNIIILGNVSTTEWYTLSTGIKVKILHPQVWLKLVMECLITIDKNITNTTELLKAIEASDTATIASANPLRRNYYWSQYGAIAYLPGAAHKALYLVYKGYPYLKLESCLNPQLILEKKAEEKVVPTPIVAPTPTVIHDTIKIIKHDTVKVNGAGGGVISTPPPSGQQGYSQSFIAGSGATVVGYNSYYQPNQPYCYGYPSPYPHYGYGYGLHFGFSYAYGYGNCRNYYQPPIRNSWSGSGAIASNAGNNSQCNNNNGGHYYGRRR